MIPKASEDLYAYKQWRKNLVPFECGTVLRWVSNYAGSTLASSINAGQCTKIIHVRKSGGIGDMETAAWEYTLVLCSKDGRKEFKKKFYWRVEGIARHFDAGTVEVSQ